MNDSDVVLIQPPFALLDQPSLGLSNLKTILVENNIKTEIIYANLLFLGRISPRLYHQIQISPAEEMIADWLFATAAFPSASEKHKRYEQYLRTQKISIVEFSAKFVQMENVLKIKKEIQPFIDELVGRILTRHPKIVGLSCGITKTFACIALANALKKINPEIITVLGGQKFPESMGQKLMQIAPSIDYIFSGEADFEFLQFCSNILNHNKFPDTHFIDCKPVEDLNSLPYPDYSDFLEQFEKFGTKDLKAKGPAVIFESSRGCWWGHSSHCCFCGLDESSIHFRTKSPERIRKEIIALYNKYKVLNFYASDNILAKNFPTQVFKEFEKPRGLRGLFYEARPNMTFEDLQIMKRAGSNSIQPGLENLNDHLLLLLNKRTTALNNIRFLRDCRSLSMFAFWNFLYAIPGETSEDYLEILDLIPFIAHLQPPVNFNAVRLMRYSPLYEEHEKYEIKDIHPLDGYSSLFPDTENIDDLAWIFTGNYRTAFSSNPDLKERLSNAIKNWQNQFYKDNPSLTLKKESDNSYTIEDTRPIAKISTQTLDEGHVQILKLLETPRQDQTIDSHLKSRELQQNLDELREWGYVLSNKNRFLALPTAPNNIAKLLRFIIGRTDEF